MSIRLAFPLLFSTLLPAGGAPGQAEPEGPHFREVLRFPLTVEQVRWVGISRDGRFAATSDRDGRVKVFDLERFSVVRQLELGRGADERDLRFVAGDRWLAVTTASAAWRLPITATEVYRIEDGARLEPTDEVLAAVEQVRLERTERWGSPPSRLAWGKRLGVQTSHRLTDIDVDASGDRAVVVVRDGGALYWNAGTTRHLDDFETSCSDLAWTADGRYLCLLRPTRMLIVEVATGAVREFLHDSAVAERAAACVGAAGPEFLVVDGRGISVWNAAVPTRLRRNRVDGPNGSLPWGDPIDAFPSPDGRRLAVTSRERQVVVDLSTGEAVHATAGHAAVAWNQAGDTVVFGSGSTSGTPGIDVLNRDGSRRRCDPPIAPNALSFVPGTSRLLCGSASSTVLFDLDDGREIAASDAFCRGFVCVAPELVVTWDFDSMTLRSLPDLAEIETLDFGPATLWRVKATPDNRRIALALEGFVLVYDVLAGEQPAGLGAPRRGRVTRDGGR